MGSLRKAVCVSGGPWPGCGSTSVSGTRWPVRRSKRGQCGRRKVVAVTGAPPALSPQASAPTP